MALTRTELKQELEIFARSQFADLLKETLRNQRADIVKDVRDLINQSQESLRVHTEQSRSQLLESKVGRMQANRSFGRISPRIKRTLGSRTALQNVGESFQIPEELDLKAETTMLLPTDHIANSTPREQLKQFVSSTQFETGVGVLVLLNAFCLGYDADVMASSQGRGNVIMSTAEEVFCFLFAMELLLRISAFGWNFFFMEGRTWNLFNTFLVMSQILEHVLISYRNMNTHMLSLVRILRVTRIVRLLRTFDLFDELRVMVHSIKASSTTLAWSCALFFMLIYMFSVMLLQSIASQGHTEHYEQINEYFSSLSRTYLTLFQCIFNGVDWDTVISPVSKDISPALAVVFCAYVALCSFALMNLVTFLFAERAMAQVREDKDHIVAKRVRDTFFSGKTGVDDDSVVTWEIFSTKLETDAMKKYFKQIDVEMSEARYIFELLDFEGNGQLDSRELVRACLQLRGPARSLELAVLHRDFCAVQLQVKFIEDGMRRLLQASADSDSGEGSSRIRASL